MRGAKVVGSLGGVKVTVGSVWLGEIERRKRGSEGDVGLEDSVCVGAVVESVVSDPGEEAEERYGEEEGDWI